MNQIKYKFYWKCWETKMISWEEALSFLNIGFILDHADEDSPMVAKPLQWTGRTDTNGVEIYHKDLVLYKGDKGVIEWENEKWIIKPDGMLALPIPLGSVNGKDVKVYSNYYLELREDELR